MVSPSHASRFTAVHEDSITKGVEWLGMAKMYRDLAPQKAPEDHSEDENIVREALQFFAEITGVIN